MATHVKVDCLIPILMYEDGAYFINPNYNVIADFRIMEELQRIFRQQKNLKIRHMILESICEIYRGKFLPEYACENWTNAAAEKYDMKFMSTILDITDDPEELLEVIELERILSCLNHALSINPYDYRLYHRSITFQCMCGHKVSAENVLRVTGRNLSDEGWSDLVKGLHDDSRIHCNDMMKVIGSVR